MSFTAQNFVNQVGPAVSAAFLNQIDQLANNALQSATTVPQLQLILGIQSPVSFPIQIADGGTGATDAADALAALGGISPASLPAAITAILTQAYLGNILYPAVVYESGITLPPVNFQYPVGYVDRYKTNASPGITDMGPAVNSAIQVALASNAAGQFGVPVVFLNGAYGIATQITFGTQIATQMIPLIIQGQGWGTQIICQTAPNTAALFNMAGHIGWALKNFYMMSGDAGRNDGIHAGAIGGTLQINWLIENVYSQMVGESFKIADTNGGVIRHCSAWVDQPPLQIVTQTWTAANISYPLHLAGGFVNNVSVYDFVGPPNQNNLVSVGIQIDCTTSEGVAIYTADVESGSGANTESGIIVNTASSITSLTLDNIYCEGTGVSLTGVFNSCFNGINDGGVGGGLVLASQCRSNTFAGINLATITDQSSTNFGNTFIGSLARGVSLVIASITATGTAVTVTFSGSVVVPVGNYVQISGVAPSGYNGVYAVTSSSAGSVTFASTTTGSVTVVGTINSGWTETVPGNSRRINCTAGGILFVDWGGSANEVLTYSASMQLVCNSTKTGVRVVVTNTSAFTFLPPLNPCDGFVMSIGVINAGGTMGTITWPANFKMDTWTNPANGKSATLIVKYDTVNWIQQGTVDNAVSN